MSEYIVNGYGYCFISISINRVTDLVAPTLVFPFNISALSIIRNYEN